MIWREFTKLMNSLEGLKKYPTLLSPYKLPNGVVLKNRLIAGMSSPYNLKGPEEFICDAVVQSYINKAKSGAGMVCIDDYLQRPYSRHIETNEEILANRLERPNPFNPDHGQHGGSGRMDNINIVNGGVQNHLSELSEGCHFYGAKVVFGFQFLDSYPGYGVSDKPEGAGDAPIWDWHPDPAAKAIPRELMDRYIDEMVLLCTMLRECGFDGIYLHLNYRMFFMGQWLSPLTNTRTDEYGGSVENMARFPIELMDAIKKRCGKDFIIFGSMNSHDIEGSYSFEDMIQYANLFKGHMDLIQIKCGRTLDESSPLGFDMDRVPALLDSKQIREGAPGMPIAVNGGFLYPEDCEKAITEGRTDLVSLCRPWICNKNYGELVYEGRSEDIRPCLRCNACHISSYSKPWVSTCAVNPEWGFEHRIEHMASRNNDIRKKIAVVGAGPAGMQAALTAAQNGNDVTIYEKESAMGGMLRRLSHISHKWPHKEYMEWMIRKVHEAGVRVFLNTEATRELLEPENYDVILVGMGARTAIPPIPGLDINKENVMTGVTVLGNEDKVKGDVVIIGGGEVGVDDGLHLAELGHRVTVIEMTDMLARTAVPIHFYSVLMAHCRDEKNFHAILNATVTSVTDGVARYRDEHGEEHEVKADTIVVASGRKPLTDEALALSIPGVMLQLIGDNVNPSNIQAATRSGFGAAAVL